MCIGHILKYDRRFSTRVAPQPGLSVVGVYCPKPRIVITGESLNLHQIPLLENNLSISP